MSIDCDMFYVLATVIVREQTNVAIALLVSSEYYVTISFLWLYTILNDQQTYGLQSTGL